MRCLPHVWHSAWVISFLSARLLCTGGESARNTDASPVGSVKNTYRVPAFIRKHLSSRDQMRNTTASFLSPPVLISHTRFTLILLWWSSAPGTGSRVSRVTPSTRNVSVSYSADSSSTPSNTTPARSARSRTGMEKQLGFPHSHTDRDVRSPQITHSKRIVTEVLAQGMDAGGTREGHFKPTEFTQSAHLVLLERAELPNEKIWALRERIFLFTFSSQLWHHLSPNLH